MHSRRKLANNAARPVQYTFPMHTTATMAAITTITTTPTDNNTIQAHTDALPLAPVFQRARSANMPQAARQGTRGAIEMKNGPRKIARNNSNVRQSQHKTPRIANLNQHRHTNSINFAATAQQNGGDTQTNKTSTTATDGTAHASARMHACVHPCAHRASRRPRIAARRQFTTSTKTL